MQIWWTVAGTLLAEPPATGPAGPQTPLAGVTVRVVGWPDERACLAVWGEARTDAEGRFLLRALRPAWAQRLWLRVALGAPGRWLTVAVAPDAVDGPHVDAGAVACAGAHPSLDRGLPPFPTARQPAIGARGPVAWREGAGPIR
jgi:hypothetical protein